ncbi:hypothetical protein [Vibrio coralliilyticus]|uniref:hypothetical protein n=1 Tax=Vibrio coralliilyticus TaxID=190893 RepID=UPI0024092225|nr:hypothetical protein [Vibrio coralliilyticus]WFB51093.1 hypothetical protein P6988_26455 [Vibrio coralliilyticus]
MPHALLEHLDHVCHQALQHTSTRPRQAYQLCLSRDIDLRIIQLRRRSGEKVELVAVGQAGERADPLSQTLVHIATRGEK